MSGRLRAVVLLAVACLVVGLSPAVAQVSGVTLAGLVQDEDGAAVAGAAVRVYRAVGPEAGWQSSIASAVTSADGRYEVAVPAGSYVVEAEAPGFAPTFNGGAGMPRMSDAVLVDEPTAVDVTLERWGSASGVASTADGQVLVGATATIRPMAPPDPVAFFPANLNAYMGASMLTGADGTFSSSQLLPTEHFVVVFPQEENGPWASEYFDGAYSEADATPVVVPSGGAVDGLAIQLEIGGVITGVVTDSSGAPVAGAWMGLGTLDGRWGGSTRTDSSGRYTLRGLVPGSFILSAGVEAAPTTYYPSTPDWAQAAPVTVGLGEVRTGIDVQVTLGVSVDLTASRDGVPLNGLWGVFFCTAPAVPVELFSISPPCTDNSWGVSAGQQVAPGHLVGNGLAAGTYNVAALVLGGGISATVQVALEPGDSLTCTFEISGPASCDIVGASNPLDADGVSDEEEAGVGPEGDGNGDSIPDAEQLNVTSINSDGPDGYVTVAAPEGMLLSSVTAADSGVGTLPPVPPGATIDGPVVSYTLSGLAPSSTVDVDVYFSEDTTADGYLKLQDGRWVALPASAVTIVSPRHVRLHLTDGGIGDEDGQANGVIVDPGAPGNLDTDGDQVHFGDDNCPAVRNPTQADLDDDGAGNACDPVFAFSGFLAPVDNTPTVNLGRAGRTYPIKWRLTGGATGVSLAAVARIGHSLVSCASFGSAPTDGLESSTTGATSLRYESASNQFIYNWRSPTNPGCYEIVLVLADESVHRAYFDLR